MLVLSRRVGEEIRIAEDIRLTVVSIRGGHVRLGISAPAHVAIFREELLTQERPVVRKKTGPAPS